VMNSPPGILPGWRIGSVMVTVMKVSAAYDISR
jgi:hypothetical protein